MRIRYDGRAASLLMVTVSLAALLPAVCRAQNNAAASPPVQDSPIQIADATPAAVAPDNASASLSEVVVTAERRSTDIQKTPVAVTSVSASFLDKGFINQLSGLNAIVPGLEITAAAGFENLVSIRGVGSETPENALTTVPGVSFFIDGAYVANSISIDQTLFDLDHIEVLRGPQGALYGQSSTGGVISLVSRQPELRTYDASGDASFGDYALFRERAEINIPVGDTLAVRVSAQAFDHDGFTLNEALPRTRLDDAHDLNGKVAVLWKPTADFSATLTGQVYHSDENGAAQKNIAELGIPALTDPRVVFQDFPATFDLTSQLYHLNLEWDLGPVILKSVSAYQQLDHVQAEDSSRSAFSVLGQYDDVAAWNTSLNNYTEEFDLLSKPGSRLDWTVGAFALVQKSRQFVAEFEGTTPPPSGFPLDSGIETAPPSNLNYGNLTRVARQSYSGFAQGTFHVTPRVRLTLGGRVNHDSYEQDAFNFSAFAVDTVSHGYNDTVGTWLGRGEFDLTPANLLYASVSRGYKPGGVNGDFGQLVVPQNFKPETNTSYEVGSKNNFLRRSLQVDLAAYYYSYRNFQFIEDDPIPFDGGIANIPLVSEYGLDAEAHYVTPNGRLHLNFTGSLENGRVEGNYFTIDSTVQNNIEGQSYPSPCAFGGIYYNPACAAAVIAGARNVQGKSPPATPKFAGSFDAAYTFDTPAYRQLPAGKLTPRVQYVYRGSEWERIFNERGLDRLDPYGVTNVNLDYLIGTTGVRVSFAATNIANVNGVNSRYTDPYGTAQTSQQYIPPRQFIGTIAYSF